MKKYFLLILLFTIFTAYGMEQQPPRKKQEVNKGITNRGTISSPIIVEDYVCVNNDNKRKIAPETANQIQQSENEVTPLAQIYEAIAKRSSMMDQQLHDAAALWARILNFHHVTGPNIVAQSPHMPESNQPATFLPSQPVVASLAPNIQLSRQPQEEIPEALPIASIDSTTHSTHTTPPAQTSWLQLSKETPDKSKDILIQINKSNTNISYDDALKILGISEPYIYSDAHALIVASNILVERTIPLAVKNLKQSLSYLTRAKKGCENIKAYFETPEAYAYLANTCLAWINKISHKKRDNKVNKEIFYKRAKTHYQKYLELEHRVEESAFEDAPINGLTDKQKIKEYLECELSKIKPELPLHVQTANPLTSSLSSQPINTDLSSVNMELCPSQEEAYDASQPVAPIGNTAYSAQSISSTQTASSHTEHAISSEENKSLYMGYVAHCNKQRASTIDDDTVQKISSLKGQALWDEAQAYFDIKKYSLGLVCWLKLIEEDPGICKEILIQINKSNIIIPPDIVVKVLDLSETYIGSDSHALILAANLFVEHIYPVTLRNLGEGRKYLNKVKHGPSYAENPETYAYLANLYVAMVTKVEHHVPAKNKKSKEAYDRAKKYYKCFCEHIDAVHASAFENAPINGLTDKQQIKEYLEHEISNVQIVSPSQPASTQAAALLPSRDEDMPLHMRYVMFYQKSRTKIQKAIDDTLQKVDSLTDHALWQEAQILLGQKENGLAFVCLLKLITSSSLKDSSLAKQISMEILKLINTNMVILPNDTAIEILELSVQPIGSNIKGLIMAGNIFENDSFKKRTTDLNRAKRYLERARSPIAYIYLTHLELLKATKTVNNEKVTDENRILAYHNARKYYANFIEHDSEIDDSIFLDAPINGLTTKAQVKKYFEKKLAQ